MQAEVVHIRAEDGSRLRKVAGCYAAPNPDKQVIQPPVSAETKAGRAHMGFNHTQLGRMLCPVKYLKDYIEDSRMYVIRSLSSTSNNGFVGFKSVSKTRPTL